MTEKEKNRILALLRDAYEANQRIVVVGVDDCKRKIIVNDSLRLAFRCIDECEVTEEPKNENGGEAESD